MSEGRSGPGGPSRVAPSSGQALPAGFSGTVGSLPLVDLLQVEALNRFSGLISVAAGPHGGRIYFQEGEIVHAEAGGTTGEDAMCLMVAWPNGSFELTPDLATLQRTIQKSFNHLMLDCHRALDEARRGPPPQAPARPSIPSPPPSVRPTPTPDARAQVWEQLRAIRGVVRLVQTGRDGRPIGDDSPEAEALAARGLYASLTHAALLGEAFGLGPLVMASVAGDEPFVVTQSHGHHLTVAVAPGVPLAGVEAQLRAVLTRPGGR